VGQGIDQEAEKACEGVIFGCANLVYTGVRRWMDTVSDIASIDEAFKLGCHRDLCVSVARMRLSLEGDRTPLPNGPTDCLPPSRTTGRTPAQSTQPKGVDIAHTDGSLILKTNTSLDGKE